MSENQSQSKTQNSHSKTKCSSSIWGGAFDEQNLDLMVEINESISFDKTLYNEDIDGSIAHAKMICNAGILKQEERDKIITGLNQIREEIESGGFQFKKELEDIHMNVESRLGEIIGRELAGRLHTARSRNDQVATDFKLYTKRKAKELESLLNNLKSEIIKKAEQHIDYICPSFTHLQVAQPVNLAHYLMAYHEMFIRDKNRFDDLNKKLNECPLGACALSGTSYNTDRFFTARELGFEKPTQNSLDSVSNRDFALEFIFNCTMTMQHISRLAEELVIWSSQLFNFVKFSDKLSTGSSIMPQKRNPDAAELLRGKFGRVLGDLTGLFSTMKGLPLAYLKDMQEDKEPLFDAYKTTKLAIVIATESIKDITFNKEKMQEAAGYGYSTATDLADLLVKKYNIPFRQCHHIVGAAVKLVIKKECKLEDLTLEQFKEIDDRIDDEVYSVLSVESSVNSKTSYGGTSKIRVQEAIERAKKS